MSYALAELRINIVKISKSSLLNKRFLDHK